MFDTQEMESGDGIQVKMKSGIEHFVLFQKHRPGGFIGRMQGFGLLFFRWDDVIDIQFDKKNTGI